jgi:hypothetical protein
MQAKDRCNPNAEAPSSAGLTVAQFHPSVTATAATVKRRTTRRGASACPHGGYRAGSVAPPRPAMILREPRR